MQASESIKSLSSFVWSVAELLRSDFKQSEYGKVVLPFVVLRRLGCLLASSKDTVLAMVESLPPNLDDDTRDMMLFDAVEGDIRVYNTHHLTFTSLRNQDPGCPCPLKLGHFFN